MSDLQIPDAAEDLWFECGCRDKQCDREGYQKDALPFIVAAELRRMAEDGRGRGWKTAERVLIALRRRADDLDGGAS